jgi:dipeptidase D
MEYIIKGRKPEKFFNYFEEISAIPRGSGNEQGIADYIVAFAKKRGLECHRDETNNVFVRMPATKGRESEGAIMLQGHTDMVCEKNFDTVHDFEAEGIKLLLDGDILRADGTTLGADNGVAVALMLAILDGELQSHPVIECLFTTSEEVGLDGAKAFDYSLVTAEKMINLDSEGEGLATVSCAGGVRTDLSMKAATVECQKSALLIKLSGLAGGHSGAEIHCGRANANKLMGRVLSILWGEIKFNLVSIEGGSKDNAIPRECRALIALDENDVKKAIDIIEAQGSVIKRELSDADKNMTLDAVVRDGVSTSFDSAATKNAISLMATVANGVFAMSHDIEGLVEYSRNLGVIKTDENGIEFIFSARSSTESMIDHSQRELEMLAGLCSCSVRHYSRYPGWRFEKESALREIYINAAKKVLGREPVIMAIHAGLECGIIKSHINNMDMISIGPEMRDIHSPDECLDLPSCERFWLIIEEMLK